MTNSSSSINLVKNKQIPVFDKFMSWALTVGRLIVIITEVVAVVAFIYRFSLDEKLVDLHSSIKQKQALISLLKQDETRYRNLQDRIALASDFSQQSTKTYKIVEDIIDLMPENVVVKDLTLNKDRINMNLNITAISALTEFINPLKNYPNIKSISIDNIENKPFTGLSVNLTAMLK